MEKRENKGRRKSLSLQQKLTLCCSLLVLGVLLLLGGTLIPQRLASFQRSLDDRIALTARLVAESGDTVSALTGGQVGAELARRLDALVAEDTDVDYIVLARTDGERIYHPDHALIGQSFTGGDEGPAAQGAEPYLTTRSGTEASQRRAFQSVWDAQGDCVGFVMVSASLANIQLKKRAILIQFALVFALALAVGIAAAGLLAGNLRAILLGHEPRTLAQMYLQREEILDHLSECLIVLSPEGEVLFSNARGGQLLGGGRLSGDFPLWPEIRETLQRGEARTGLLTEWAGLTLLAKLLPLEQGGVLLILRDRTEYARIDQQLTGTNHVIEALRANTHEFLNKLHVIAGLLQIGETQRAIAYINEESEATGEHYQRVVRQLRDRTVAALVLGKASHAREEGIRFSLRRDSSLPEQSGFLTSDELVSIVGNLVENAFEAVKDCPLKEVELFLGEDERGLTISVDDTGRGMTREQIDTLRQRQYSTKGDGHGFGLRLIQRIVASRGGYLDIESEPGEGSSFTVSFMGEEGGETDVKDRHCGG